MCLLQRALGESQNLIDSIIHHLFTILAACPMWHSFVYFLPSRVVYSPLSNSQNKVRISPGTLMTSLNQELSSSHKAHSSPEVNIYSDPFCVELALFNFVNKCDVINHALTHQLLSFRAVATWNSILQPHIIQGLYFMSSKAAIHFTINNGYIYTDEWSSYSACAIMRTAINCRDISLEQTLAQALRKWLTKLWKEF